MSANKVPPDLAEAMSEIKLFGRWSFDEINVGDQNDNDTATATTTTTTNNNNNNDNDNDNNDNNNNNNDINT